jgi:hypothetical protein
MHFSVQLAQSLDPVLGVRWGVPGRLLPPMHNGQEMLFLSASACIHAVRVPAEVMWKYCSANAAVVGSGNANASDKLASPHWSSAPKSQQAKALGLESANNAVKMEAPKFCLSGLKRYVVPSPRADPSSSASVSGYLPLGGDAAAVSATAPWSSSAHRLATPLSSADPAGAAAAPSSFGSSALSLSGVFWERLQEGVLLLERQLQAGLLEGLTLGNVDKSARQVRYETLACSLAIACI